MRGSRGKRALRVQERGHQGGKENGAETLPGKALETTERVKESRAESRWGKEGSRKNRGKKEGQERPSRPKCTCRCGCRVRPGRRRQCPVCGAMVGPGCHPTPCWDQNMGCCHMCVGGNPQESYEKLAEEMHVRTFAFLSDVDHVRCAAECFRRTQLCSRACVRPLGHMDLLPRWQDGKI